MKTAKELRFEIERQKELNKLKEINETVEWLEMVISRYIKEGKTSMELFGWDRGIEKNYDKIKPILVNAGYKVIKKEEVVNVGPPFLPEYKTETKIHLSWE